MLLKLQNAGLTVKLKKCRIMIEKYIVWKKPRDKSAGHARLSYTHNKDASASNLGFVRILQEVHSSVCGYCSTSDRPNKEDSTKSNPLHTQM